MEYLVQILGGLMGIAFHVFAVKLPSYKKLCIAGNKPFTAKGFFECDWIAIVASFIAVVLVVFCLDEIMIAKSQLRGYVKLLMVFVGFTGSSVIIAVLGKATKSALTIIDIKTNIADGKTPPHEN